MSLREKIFLPAVLGSLTAFGPIVSDFYLPVMPEMAGYFHTSPSLVAMSLTTAMVGLALGQLLIGPLSDKYGRRPLLLLSLALFVVASVGCVFSRNIGVFNALRLFQGVGGAGCIVLSKGIPTDLYSGRQLLSFLALLGAINGVAPVAGPVVGGAVAQIDGWRGVFVMLMVIGVVLLVCSFFVHETLPAERRNGGSLMDTYAGLFRVFRSPLYRLSTVADMMAFFTFFAYLSSSPFILQQCYGMSSLHFSLCFGLCALMIGVGSLCGAHFHHPNTALKWGSMSLAAATVLVAACLFSRAPLAILVPCYILTLLSFGLMQPMATSIAMESGRENTGAASAVFGACGFLAGGIASPLVGLGDITTTTAVLMLVGSFGCMAFALPLAAIVKRQGMLAQQKAGEDGAPAE